MKSIVKYFINKLFIKELYEFKKDIKNIVVEDYKKILSEKDEIIKENQKQIYDLLKENIILSNQVDNISSSSSPTEEKVSCNSEMKFPSNMI